MANDPKNGDKGIEYYSYLLINKTKRAGFLMIFTVVFIFMTTVIMANSIQNGSWTQVLFPVVLLGIPMIFYPRVEEWVYKPWQAKAQKYERHYRF